MPALTIPTPTPDELDDLIYFARTGDLPSLRTTLTTVCATHGCAPSTILASAIDIDADGLGSQSCLLHWPAANGNVDVLTYLLGLLSPEAVGAGAVVVVVDKSAPSLVNHRNVNGNTPLHWAALNAHLECVKVLVAGGADAGVENEVGHDAVFEAEVSGKEGGREVAEWMLRHCEGLERGARGGRSTEGEAAVEEEEVVVDEQVGETGDGGAKDTATS